QPRLGVPSPKGPQPVGRRAGQRRGAVFGAGAAPRGYPQGRGSYRGGLTTNATVPPSLMRTMSLTRATTTTLDHDVNGPRHGEGRAGRAARRRTWRRSTGPAPSRWSNTPRLPARRAATRPWTRGGERLSWATRRRTSSWDQGEDTQGC